MKIWVAWAVVPLMYGVTAYPTMFEPLVTPGAVQVSEAEAVAVRRRADGGRPGTLGATTELEADDALPVPTPLVAVTVNE